MDPKLKFGSMDSNLEIRIRNDLLLTCCWSVSVSLQKLFSLQLYLPIKIFAFAGA